MKLDPRRLKVHPPAGVALLIGAIAARTLRVDACELFATTRGPARVSCARQVAMYLAHITFGVTYSALGRAWRRDPSTVRYACAAIETRRENPRFDALLGRLEAASWTFVDALHAQSSPPNQTSQEY